MREFSLFFNGDSLGREEFMPVDRLVNADGAQAVEAIQLDIGGKDMHSVVTIGDWDEEIKDISFIFLISLRCLPSSLPLRVPPVSILSPMLVGFFQASRICLMLCQIVALLFEDFELFLIVAADFLILACNSSQSVCNEEEFLSPGISMAFKSSVHGLGRQLELTEFLRDGCNGSRNGEGLLVVDHWGLGCQPDWKGFGGVHVDCKAGGSGRGDVCRVGRGHV